MIDQEDIFNLGKIVFDDNNQKRNSWACLGQTCSTSLIVFLSQLFNFCWLYLVAFGEFIFQKRVLNQLFGWESCVLQQDTFHPRQDYEQVTFYKRSHLYIIGWSVRDGNSQLIYNWLKIGIFQPKFDKIYILSIFPATLRCYAKRNFESRVCSRCKL